ncbi:MAG: type II toxin-antitoxin system HipA family toxin [Solirubrobacteraceae bacterium]
MTVAAVNLWGRRIGAVSQESAGEPAIFEYAPEFVGAGVELSPLRMPVSRVRYRFPALAFESFRGLPGMLADSLPDDFGNAVIDAWLARQGRAPETFSAVERLCYIGRRGMGALEFAPTLGPTSRAAESLEVSALVDLAGQVLAAREGLHTSLAEAGGVEAMREILLVGSSAGGARAKAVIAYDPLTGSIRSGQLDAPNGFAHWILKLDGVDSHREFGNAQGYGAIEYAYAAMARAAGLEMSECLLLEEGGRRHFMTRRFDRDGNEKIHMQSLAALAHLDFRQAGAHSYEQALQTVRELGLSAAAVAEQFRRAVFNIVARNQDDHVKNIAFLMDREGRWALSPAFDVTYAYNPRGVWTGQHQMSLAGKRDGFTLADLRECARGASMARGAAERILGEVVDAVSDWLLFAREAGVEDQDARAIAASHRLKLPGE